MKTTRRTMLEHTGVAALGLLLPGCATKTPADPRTTIPSETPPMPEYTKLNAARGRLAALDADAPGFVLHGLAQGELSFKHSVVLHELYFGNLVGGGSTGVTTKTLLTDHFGGAAAWEERFRALGQSLGGGSGWAILELDLHEHSYHMDYGTAAAKYIDAFFANLHLGRDRSPHRAGAEGRGAAGLKTHCRAAA